MRHHHQQQQQHTDAAAQQQHQQRLTVAAVPHYATMAIAVPSPHAVTVHGAPSPVVPVYSSFSEALREQQKQQQQARALAHQFQQQQQHAPAYHQGQSQLQQQQHDVRPTGSGGHVGHSPSMPVTSTGGALHHVPLPHARQVRLEVVVIVPAFERSERLQRSMAFFGFMSRRWTNYLVVRRRRLGFSVKMLMYGRLGVLHRCHCTASASFDVHPPPKGVTCNPTRYLTTVDRIDV